MANVTKSRAHEPPAPVTTPGGGFDIVAFTGCSNYFQLFHELGYGRD